MMTMEERRIFWLVIESYQRTLKLEKTYLGSQLDIVPRRRIRAADLQVVSKVKSGTMLELLNAGSC